MDCSRIENSNMNGFLSVEYIVDVLWKMISGEMEYMVLLPMDESAILSACGGIAGVILGTGVVALGGAVLGLKTVIKPSVILIAVTFSAVVGIFFGLYPALKAAKADPIDALRYE